MGCEMFAGASPKLLPLLLQEPLEDKLSVSRWWCGRCCGQGWGLVS